jgi:hypothetical protein
LKNTIRRRGDAVFIRVSDMLKDAPEDVTRALGVILFNKLEGKNIPKREERLYRDYANSEAVRNLVQKIRSERVKKAFFGPKGENYDLQKSFERINNRYFKGELVMPNLTWSKRKTHTRFGHHDAAFNTIVISRTLDNKELPSFLLDYVMFHEALHMKHGWNYKEGKRQMHTKDFKAEEKMFAEFKRAKALLKKLSGRTSIRD